MQVYYRYYSANLVRTRKLSENFVEPYVQEPIIEERGVSGQVAGGILALFPIGGLVAALTSGTISDKVGLRKPFIWPFGLLSPIVFVLIMFDLPMAMLGVLAFAGGYLALAPVTPIMAVPYELPGITPAEVAVGVSFGNMIQTFGFVLGPILVGNLAELFGGDLRPAMFIGAAAPITVTVMGLMIRETGHRASGAFRRVHAPQIPEREEDKE